MDKLGNTGRITVYCPVCFISPHQRITGIKGI